SVQFSKCGKVWYYCNERCIPESDGVKSLTASHRGEEHLFVWDSSSDLPDVGTYIYIKIKVKSKCGECRGVSNQFIVVNDDKSAKLACTEGFVAIASQTPVPPLRITTGGKKLLGSAATEDNDDNSDTDSENGELPPMCYSLFNCGETGIYN